MNLELILNGVPVEVSVERKGGGNWKAVLRNKTFDIDFAELDENTASLLINGRSVTVHAAKVDDTIFISTGGRRYSFSVPEEDSSVKGKTGARGGNGDQGKITTPMPGLIVDVIVSEGDTVKAGDTLVILEAMKMENAVKAPFDGVVNSVNVSKGAQANLGEILVEISPLETGDADNKPKT